MHRFRLALIAGAAIAATVLVTAGSAAVTQPQVAARANATTMVFGAEQEPSCWNAVLADCSLFWGVMLTQPMLQGAYQLYPDFTLRPQLVTKAVLTNKPFTVTYTINPLAKWNDGKPVSANDFIFTWKTYINPANQVSSREGYDLITKAKALSGKKVKFTYKSYYTRWKYLFAPVFPQHALQGADFNHVWDKGITNPKNGQPISNGPFLWNKWDEGAQLKLVKNPNYWGWSPTGKGYGTGKLHKAAIDTFIFRFITNTNSEIQAMKSGEVDAIYPQPQLALADLADQPGLKVQSNAGSTFEGLTWNLDASKASPYLRAPWVRQALQYSIDRQALVKNLFKSLKPNLQVLQHNMLIQQQKGYKPLFKGYVYDPSKVRQLMTKHGCTRGGDNIWVCAGNRMSFKFGTTAGNRLRELGFEIMQAQAKVAGFELKAAFQPAGVFFSSDGVFGGNFEIADYADVSDGDPGAFVPSFKCGGEANYGKWCDAKATKLLEATNVEPNEDKRLALFNQAEARMVQNTPRFPLYQKPTYFVYKNKVKGLIDCPNVAGATWNIMDWKVS